MSRMDTVARSLHDLGLASWFGGSLMGAVGLNAAVGEIDDPRQRARAASDGWARWTPVNSAAIASHLFGAVQLTWTNKGRIAGQRGVAAAAATKGALTLAALGATGYARALGKKVERAGDVPVAGGAEPMPQTPEEVAKAQRQLRIMQWTIPALTGATLVLNALMGEQQRPAEVGRGVFRRLLPGA